jgi:hypothetical protein
VLGAASGTVTITNDDAQPTISLTSSATSMGEAGGGTVTYTVTRGANSSGAVSLVVTLSGSATRGSDYTIDGLTVGADGTAVLTLADGVTSAQFTVRVVDDTAVEGDETVGVSIGSCSGCGITGATSRLLAILDDDVPPTVTLTATATSTREGDRATVTYTVTRSGPTGSAVSVVVTLGGTATRGSDYSVGGLTVSGATATLTLAAGVTSATFTVTVTDDTTREADETVAVSLSACAGCVLGSPSARTLTILDDDAPVLPVVSVRDASVREGSGGTTTVTMTVTLSAAATSDVRVQLRIAGGTATAGTDYRTWSPTTLEVLIRAGSTSATFTVAVLGDRTAEPDETVVIQVVAVTGATGLSASGTLTILDDDRKQVTAVQGPGAEPVSTADGQRVLAAALALWRSAGADPALLARVRLVIAPLGAGELGEFDGTTVRISPDAAGWGWSTDLRTVAAGRIDLLSVLVHEIGHVLGLGHDDPGMSEVLLPGVRDLSVLHHVHLTHERPHAGAPVIASSPAAGAAGSSGRSTPSAAVPVPASAPAVTPVLHGGVGGRSGSAPHEPAALLVVLAALVLVPVRRRTSEFAIPAA